VDVYRNLYARLVERGRLEWLDEDFASLSSDALYSNPPEDAWLRVKGGNRLKGPALSVLQALAEWRESRAQQRDRPRGWILRDDALIEIARHRPASIEELARIRGLQEAFIRHNGEKLLGLVARAGRQSPAPFPETGVRLKLTPEQDALVDVMSAVVRISANEHAINPAVLATRKQLERLVSGDADVEILHGWRHKLVGERLQALLSGELNLSVKGGKLVL
jgi:ribonuclease D